jgi:hypothetical protein
LALVLLIATGLLGRSFLRLRQVNPGFDLEGRAHRVGGASLGEMCTVAATARGVTAREEVEHPPYA